MTSFVRLGLVCIVLPSVDLILKILSGISLSVELLGFLRLCQLIAIPVSHRAAAPASAKSNCSFTRVSSPYPSSTLPVESLRSQYPYTEALGSRLTPRMRARVYLRYTGRYTLTNREPSTPPTRRHSLPFFRARDALPATVAPVFNSPARACSCLARLTSHHSSM
jgi:hypothetical protein